VSWVAETVSSWIGIPVLREGNILRELAQERFSVVETRSGIRPLLSGVPVAGLRLPVRLNTLDALAALLRATVPIAIAAHASRVTL
jgi:hypothetical protein